GDQRDYDFAKHFNIPIPNIFEGVDISEEAFADKEKTIIANSDFLNGLSYKEATKKVIAELENIGQGEGKTNYRLRDAVFSRQRYWGEPFPVYYVDGMPQMIDAKHLPIKLPEVEKYLPTETGEPPLGNATVWAWDTKTNTVVSNEMLKQVQHDKTDDDVSLSAVEGSHNGIYPLELNTMPGWAGSSWYFNRYMDASNPDEFASQEALNYWRDVDLYIGGSEHATGHLLYSRFWQKFLFDKGLVPVDEYAKKLINQGMILGTSAFVYRIKPYPPHSSNVDYNGANIIELTNNFPNSIFVSKNLIDPVNGIKVNSKEYSFVTELYFNWLKENGVEIHINSAILLTFHVQPIHADVYFVNASDELDIEAFRKWREDYKDAIFIGEKGEVIQGN